MDIHKALQILAQVKFEGITQEAWNEVVSYHEKIEDKLHRRNMQIKELKRKMDNCPECIKYSVYR